jgi:hypothetical protein
MSTIIVPAAIVRELRGALYIAMSSAAEQLASLGYERGTTLDQWQKWTATFDRARSLLDRIGWQDREPETDVELDIDHHRRALTDTLGEDLLLIRSIAADSATEPAIRPQYAERVRAVEGFALSAGLDLERERVERRITIPADFTDVLLDSLLEAMRHGAEAIQDCGLDAALYSGPLARFDSIRAALDAIEWGERAGIDADAHAGALRSALAARLDLERHMMADGIASIAKGHKGAEQQRDTAHAYTLAIEQFMDAAGLEIPKAGEPDA